MRFALRSHLLSGLICVAILSSTVVYADDTPAPAPKASPAKSLVIKALQAEVAGNGAERDFLINKALEVDPDYAPAHWHHGDVRGRVRGIEVWMPVDEAEKELARRGKVDQYRQLLPSTPNTADSQYRLANWCLEAGLMPQAQMHLLKALAKKPSSRAIMEQLGVVRFRGRYAPTGEVEQVMAHEKEYAASLHQWGRRLDKLLRDANEDSPNRQAKASEELRAIDDPTAIAGLEARSVEGGSVYGLAIVEAFANMPEQQATNALVRQAVCSPYSEVRQAASVALNDRSIFGYVPTLMSVLQAPIRFRNDVWGDDGRTFHQLTMFQEGPFAAKVFSSQAGASLGDTIITKHPIRKTPDDTMRIIHNDPTLAQDNALAQRAAAYNVAARAWNSNAISAMNIATGVQLGSEPTSWWNWWFDYNELYVPPVKPVTVSTRESTPPPTSNGVEIRYVSCFIAGTKVWAMDGPVAIENVKPGEWVLAQDPATGELAYKPVLATTIRPPSAVRAIKIKEDTIVATRGHPFWVSGKGWQMTKELEPNQFLHTVEGPTRILGAEYVGEAACHNLVVAGFGNYFVGEKKVLVHDNTIRDVTPALVPGLVAPKP